MCVILQSDIHCNMQRMIIQISLFFFIYSLIHLFIYLFIYIYIYIFFLGGFGGGGGVTYPIRHCDLFMFGKVLLILLVIFMFQTWEIPYFCTSAMLGTACIQVEHLWDQRSLGSHLGRTDKKNIIWVISAHLINLWNVKCWIFLKGVIQFNSIQ